MALPARMSQFCSYTLALLLCFSATAQQPNVIVFLADDAGWGDYSQNGNTSVATPNIDRIAKEGVTMDRFYVCPVCSPTRAEFLTGRYHPRTGVKGVSTGQERMSLDEKTVADAFKGAGYATGAFGKWHNGSQWPYHPMARGFDEYYGHTSGHWGEYFDPPLEHNGKPVREKGYIVDLCTSHALKFIERNKDRPFFCFIPFTTPHTPWSVPPEDWERFKDKPISQSATAPENEVLQETRATLAMMENQDRNVGRVLELLDAHELARDTIVIYFSDNGPNKHRWTGGMKGTKGTTDEGGVRSTFYIRYPDKLPAASLRKEISAAIDLLPTLTSLAGISRVGDKPLDGRDISPLLTGAETTWAERMLFQTWGGNVSVRSQTHRLDAQGNLYDMIADPGQTKAIQGEQTELAASLVSAVDAFRKDVLGGEAIPSSKAKSKGGKGKGGSVDPRPISVGYEVFPRTWLPARDAQPSGPTIRRSSGAPNCSYFVNWKSLEDRVTWNLDVQSTGSYEVELLYTCPEGDEGSVIKLTCGDAELVGTVSQAWNPPLYTNQDTLPRPEGESKMKPFRALNLGTIKLMKGQAPLVIQATAMPGESVMDLLELNLTLKP
jgi:arylsulfatase A-like enzyme